MNKQGPMVVGAIAGLVGSALLRAFVFDMSFGWTVVTMFAIGFVVMKLLAPLVDR
jgi:hypothetical protein